MKKRYTDHLSKMAKRNPESDKLAKHVLYGKGNPRSLIQAKNAIKQMMRGMDTSVSKAANATKDIVPEHLAAVVAKNTMLKLELEKVKEANHEKEAAAIVNKAKKAKSGKNKAKAAKGAKKAPKL